MVALMISSSIMFPMQFDTYNVDRRKMQNDDTLQ